jgi:transcriptional regulator with XRE-family HTH domain
MAKSIFTEEHRRFVSALRAVREAEGVTQVQLSERLGRNQSYISNIERGQRRIDVIEFMHIAEALGRQAAQLFGEILKAVKTDR